LSQKKIVELPLERRYVILQNLVVPTLEERQVLVKNIHEEIGHFSERRTLAKVKNRFFWHNKRRCEDGGETMPTLLTCQKFRKH